MVPLPNVWCKSAPNTFAVLSLQASKVIPPFGSVPKGGQWTWIYWKKRRSNTEWLGAVDRDAHCYSKSGELPRLFEPLRIDLKLQTFFWRRGSQELWILLREKDCNLFCLRKQGGREIIESEGLLHYTWSLEKQSKARNLATKPLLLAEFPPREMTTSKEEEFLMGNTKLNYGGTTKGATLRKPIRLCKAPVLSLGSGSGCCNGLTHSSIANWGVAPSCNNNV